MTERNFTILDEAITTATSITSVLHGDIPISTNGITIQGVFVRGGGGTTVKTFIQTTLDDGTTWVDIASLAFTTASASKIVNISGNTPVTTPVVPVDGALADNTVVDGIIGTGLRARYVTTGTYTGTTTVKIDIKLHN